MGFACWLRYCSDITHRRPTKLCTMFDHLLGWYTIYTFSRALAPRRNFARCKIHFTSKSCVLLYWQRCCTALQQPALAKLCGVAHEIELRNFRRGRHLYLAGRPSRWASAHILVNICYEYSGYKYTANTTACQLTNIITLTSNNILRQNIMYTAVNYRQGYWTSRKQTNLQSTCTQDILAYTLG